MNREDIKNVAITNLSLLAKRARSEIRLQAASELLNYVKEKEAEEYYAKQEEKHREEASSK